MFHRSGGQKICIVIQTKIDAPSVPLRGNQVLQTEVDLRLEGQYSYTSLIPVADTIGLDAAPLNEFFHRLQGLSALYSCAERRLCAQSIPAVLEYLSSTALESRRREETTNSSLQTHLLKY